MNKAKINDLYEQAHRVYEIPYEASVVEPGHIAIHKQKVWDRYLFAELIVRECADIVADAVDHREPASTYVGKIKQHFGVEE